MTAALKSIEAKADAAIEQTRRNQPPPFYGEGDPGEQPLPVRPLTITFADTLPKEFIPPDELIEGMLSIGRLSMLYGDSNSGKTFAAISMACAVASGTNWLGKRTERSAVVYLATESPASVIARVQAYQGYFGVRVPNFAIVHDPINLFASDADVTAVANAVRSIEAEQGVKVGLIVCDTLARMSAGANENSGEDMGQIIARLERLKDESGAHVMVIHHSGKNAANGARGWSGIRAAIDTEIEVTDTDGKRCLEITKQRDLPTKGDRIGFRLEPVTMGQTKWDAPATSCVVLNADAPVKLERGKRLSQIAGSIEEFLLTRGTGSKKRDIVAHFEGRHDKSAIYRELKKMAEAGLVVEIAGVVAINKGVPNGAN